MKQKIIWCGAIVVLLSIVLRLLTQSSQDIFWSTLAFIGLAVIVIGLIIKSKTQAKAKRRR